MPTTTLRRCVGSARFGIEPHEAPVDHYPKQPSQKDGLGRMCIEHWKAYASGLLRESLATQAAFGRANRREDTDRSRGPGSEESEAHDEDD